VRPNRKALALGVLEALQDALKRRDVYVSPSERWADLRAKLLSGEAWEAARSGVLRALELPASPEEYLAELGQRLDTAYQRAAENLPDNADVTADPKTKDKDALNISRLDELEEPASLIEIRDEFGAMLPRVDLPELLLEVHERIGFADAFTHVSEGGHRVEDLHKSVCAVLVAETCNVGLEPLVREHVHMLGRYQFTLDESVAGGGMRPLRDPSELDEFEFPPPDPGRPSL
jgi:hypothetical protein